MKKRNTDCKEINDEEKVNHKSNIDKNENIFNYNDFEFKYEDKKQVIVISKKRKRDDDNFIKQDCRDRIAKLEALLVESSSEKNKMRETILNLTEKVSALTVKVEFLQKENVELMNRLTKN